MARKVKPAFSDEEMAERDEESKGLSALPFLHFVERASKGRYKTPYHFVEICEAVELAEQLTSARHVIAAPVQHGKTTILEFAIAWILLRHPDRPIIYVTYGAKKAEKHSRRIRAIFAACGGQLSEDFNTIHQWQTTAGGGLLAVSADGEITGNDAVHIFYDDPYKGREEADSAEHREKIEEKFSSEVVTRMAPGGSITVVASRWHEEDLSGVLIRRGYVHIHLRAIKQVEVTNDDGTVDVVEQALCPWGPDPRYPRTLEFLKAIRDGGDVTEYDWASLYQGEPRPKLAGLFRGVTLYDADELDGANIIRRYVIGADFAYSKSGDRIVFVVLGEADSGIYYLLEVFVARASILEKLDDLRALQAGYTAAETASYTSGPERETVRHMARISKAEGGPVRVLPLLAHESKYLRAGRCSRAWNVGKVRVLRGAPWAEEFVRRVIGFTGADGQRDDEVDALVSGYDYLSLFRKAGPTGANGRVTVAKRASVA